MSEVVASRRRRRAVALVVGSLLVLGACGVEQGARSTVRTAPEGVIGSDVEQTTTTVATTTTIPPPELDITGARESEVNRVIANAVTDLEDWWEDAYPEAYDGEPYLPLDGGLWAIDSDTAPIGLPCAQGISSIEELLNNAYYCPPEDAVVWDQEIFMPQLAEDYGLFTVAVVIAHEWGHVIQERAVVREPSVIIELQADCFAGAWTARVDAGETDRFEITTDELDQALAGILSLRDAPGGSAEDPFAHGSGFDRVGAFQDGFENGVARCAEYTNGDPTPFQFPFTDEGDLLNEGNLHLTGPEDDPGIIELTFPSLDAFWADTFPAVSDGAEWNPMGDPVAFGADDPPTCGDEVVEDFVLFVCVPDRFVGFEIDQTIPAAYEQNGDFAVATLFATQYGLDAVDQLGSADTEVEATLQADCFAGAWAAELLPPDPPEDYQLVLSPGDLDEGVAVLLSFRSEGDRERQGPGFDRVRAYRQGVLQGAEACPTLTS